MSIAKSPTKDGKKITITFYIKKEAAAGADKIFLICEHNGWEPVAMKPQKNGTFRGSITVPTDIQPSYQYRFKYIMNDGEVKFDNDWDAESYCRNDFGTENSVFTVQQK
ncbi:isoamylase early set domain-containing protein [Anaerobiospirillum succiniciproducens]|uniref:isoamylase early set domain-containing protein n=1 Tax=Anaerobiospirillum succiniciproducens TaxID=13335 RepID=UPI0004222801|nr:isoamylase early set domain-containing protein [Anaerobiospirillum succiniciproducens]MCI6863824.1 isoamylase early set domain-containing protein [Anaerobiospirillum succiniciproducens]MDO4675318.1 isoamylase early set domain-containing protein [Anaerobiospirillum succiniciproducens]